MDRTQCPQCGNFPTVSTDGLIGVCEEPGCDYGIVFDESDAVDIPPDFFGYDLGDQGELEFDC